MAANFDYVFIMDSLNHNFNTRRIERYLVAAWQSGAIPVVILTKADLVDDFTEQLLSVEKIAVGVRVFTISTFRLWIRKSYGVFETGENDCILRLIRCWKIKSC